MNMFQHIAKVTTVAVVTVLFAASFAAAEQGGRYWVPPTTERRYAPVGALRQSPPL